MLKAIARRELCIDAERAARRIEAFIRRVRSDQGTAGVLIGLSGGIDSALLAGLAVRALGRKAVHVAYLTSADLNPDDAASARQVGDWLGLDLEVIDTEGALRRRGFYRSRVLRWLSFRPAVSAGPLVRLYRLVAGEPWFVSGLRGRDFGGRPVAGAVFRLAVEPVLAAQHARHVYRREVLERRAKAVGAVLLGAGNRSELLTGYFTPGAVDDVPASPLLGLYKTQVRQLAAHLGVPRRVRLRPPSAGGAGRVGDEVAMATSYAAIDLVLDATDRGRPADLPALWGIEPETVRRVRQMRRLSIWKRRSPHLAPPADGGPRSDLRTAPGGNP